MTTTLGPTFLKLKNIAHSLVSFYFFLQNDRGLFCNGLIETFQSLYQVFSSFVIISLDMSRWDLTSDTESDRLI